MWNMSCIQCQDVHVPLPQPPPAPSTTTSSVHKLLRSCSLGRLEQRNQGGAEQSEGTVGVLQLHLPGSLGLTGGCVPYQDPVYSQPQRLPGTHFHKAAWSPVWKLIPLCRRCTAMLSAPLCTAPTLHSAPAVSLFCFHLFSLHLICTSFLVCHISSSSFQVRSFFYQSAAAVHRPVTRLCAVVALES